MRILRGSIKLRAIGTVALVLALATVAAGQAARADDGLSVLFKQQDTVVAFDLATGVGQQVGTVTGAIRGTSIVNFKFTSTGPTTFTFNNTVVLTDVSGDQIEFANVGTGKLIAPPIDPTIFGLGGPLTGTYKVIKGTGKFTSWVGKTFPSRAVFSSPVALGFPLGTSFVEVLSNNQDD